MLAVALPEGVGEYDEVSSDDKPRGMYYMASNDIAKSLAAEDHIYDTPCSDDVQNCGPIYCSPSADETKLYEEFEGKKFRKLFRKELQLVLLVHVSSMYSLSWILKKI